VVITLSGTAAEVPPELGSLREELTSEAKALTGKKDFIAASKRCAAQEHRFQ